MKKISLNEAWAERRKLVVEGNKIWDGGNTPWDGGDTLQAKGERLWDAAVKAHGREIIAWLYRSEKNDHACRLDSGEMFEP